MRITLDQWLELEAAAKAADKVLDALHSKAIETMLVHHDAGNERERELLHRIVERAWDAMQTLSASLFHVQEEWTGGDSSNPRNFTLREPNWVGIAHSFSKEQIDKYRGENGEIILPTRHPVED